MITIWEYYKRHKIDDTFIKQLIIQECGRPYEPIQAFGREIPQSLTTSLKRIYAKAIKHINGQLRKRQQQERVRHGGGYYTKRRYATRPLHLCGHTLRIIDDYLATLDKWETETDDAGLPTKKTLTYRHPYRHECCRLLSMALLIDPRQAEPKA